MVCDKQINLNAAADATLCTFTTVTFRVKECVQNITLLTGYTRTCGFSRRTIFLLVCMRVRVGPLFTYKAKRWAVPFRNGCWQCWKGYWGSETPRLHGVSCESVDWNNNPYSSIGITQQCGCTFFWLNPAPTQWKRYYMLTCSWVHDPMIAGQHIFFLPWMVWYDRTSSNKSCKTVNPLILAVLT